MTICFFGIYNPDYSRNSILIKGLEQNGVKILFCNSRSGRIKKYLSLVAKHWQIRKKYDVMLVAYPGYQAVILAKLLTRKTIILDAFFSLYDCQVCDRKINKPHSLKAFYYWFLDWLSCSLADKVLLDTQAQIRYFCRLFHLKEKKFMRVLVGADNEFIKPRQPKDKDCLLIHFHGYATPLQGVSTIVAAAHLLEHENIKFNLVGNKIKRYDAKAGLAGNINYIMTAPYPELVKIMAEADVCLGIFGDTTKTQVVIPNKVYEALAAGKAVITADTPAARELLIDHENCLFCRTSDPKDLAEKIMILKNNPELLKTIAEKGYNLFINRLTPQKVTAELAALIEQYGN